MPQPIMLKLNRLHHIAIICRDYQRSKQFYLDVLGCRLESEVYRAERHSYKADLSINGQYLIELFSFPNPPARPSHPEAAGLRHLAFEVDNLDSQVRALQEAGIPVEPIRVDELTQKRFTFFADPDDLPIELYER